MKYDFTSIIDRKGKDALALDGIGKNPGFSPEPPDKQFDIIPMWIADMNFATVPSVQSAIIERAKHPTFGYFSIREEYYQLIIDWHKRRNNTQDLIKDYIGYQNGVLGGITTALNIFCSKGDKVLVQYPLYVGFKNLLENNGYKIIGSELIKDENGIYRIDYEDMEKKIKENNIHTTIFCSPHNPIGRVWEKEEIIKVMELFEKYEINIISDEIWSDIILYDYKHIPTQSINNYAKNHTIALYAPSKTFNLSGLVGAYYIIYNKALRDRFLKESSLSHYNDINLLSMYSLIGAYSKEGYEWVDELKKVLTENVEYAINFIKNNFKGVEVSPPQGTYMIYVDCTNWCKKHNKTIEEVEKAAWKVGVALQDGRMFNGPFHLRLNIALPLSKVKDAFDRLDKYVFNIK